MKGQFNHKKKVIRLDDGTMIEAGTVGFMGYYASINGKRIPRQFISLDSALTFAINTESTKPHVDITSSYGHIKGKV